ncbi:MAG: DUF4831 family protein [Dysgonamonadaceae bacterium]
MKRIFTLIISTLLITGLLKAQETIQINAVKANNFGVTYTLPKTSVVFTFTIKKTIKNRGEFYPYAKQYLGIENPVTENEVIYTLENVEAYNKGIPDKSNSYLVEFKSNSLEPYVYLTKDNLICAINAAPELELIPLKKAASKSEAPVDASRFFSQEVLIAGSTGKQAELVSRQILDLRRSRTDILTGEADNMPPDGEAYKVVMDQINLQEKALSEMFSGSTQTEIFTDEITIVPDEKNIDRAVIARFSEKLGLLDSDDLAGEPVYLTLTNKTPPTPIVLTEKEQKKMDEKFATGLIYNIPGKAKLLMEYKQQPILNKEFDIVQFGTKDVLVKKMFDNLKLPIKIIFYPELGAIKQIIQ